jgi:hypothetical protein
VALSPASALANAGGTGRFADASGTLRSTTEVSPISFDEVTLVNSYDGTVRGRVSY